MRWLIFYHGDIPFEIVFDFKSEWDNNADLRGVFDDNECAQARTEKEEGLWLCVKRSPRK